MSQQLDTSESMDAFYMRVKDQVQLLKLNKRTAMQIEKLLILAQLAICTSEPVLRTKALKDGKLNVKDFLDYARAYKIAKKQT